MNTPILRARFFGPHAAFIGEKKDEPKSYAAPTPSAARAMMEAILWKPAIFWHVRRVYILNPIRWFTFRTNEVKSRCVPGGTLVVEQDRCQRTLTGLRDVDYVIEAQFSFTKKRGPDEQPSKFVDMFQRRLARGQAKMQPYLGRRDFPAFFEEAPATVTPAETLVGRRLDLGMMLLDRHYGENIVPEYFHAEIRDGVLVEKGKDCLPHFEMWEA